MKAIFISFIALPLMLKMTNLFLLQLIIQLKLYQQLKRIIFWDSISPRKSQANGIKILKFC